MSTSGTVLVISCDQRTRAHIPRQTFAIRVGFLHLYRYEYLCCTRIICMMYEWINRDGMMTQSFYSQLYFFSPSSAWRKKRNSERFHLHCLRSIFASILMEDPSLEDRTFTRIFFVFLRGIFNSTRYRRPFHCVIVSQNLIGIILLYVVYLLATICLLCIIFLQK